MTGEETPYDEAGAARSRGTWFPVDVDPSPARLRKHALADQLRALVEQVVYLDVETAAQDDPALLDAVAARLEQARAALEAAPTLRGRLLHLTDHDASLFERSPLSGRSNALAAPLVMRFEGPLTFGHATYGPAFEGPPGCVHGGYVISAFDDLLGVAQAASGHAGLTGTLTVRLRRTTPLSTRIDYEAGVRSVEGRKVVAWGRSLLDGQVLAEAEGIFIVPVGGHPAHVSRAAHEAAAQA